MNHYIRTAGRFLQYGIFVSVLILAAAPARAASVSFFLDQSNKLPDGVNYLSVSLMDNDTGGVNILVKTLDPLNRIAGDRFGIQKFGFGLSNGDFEEITDLPDGWKVKHDKRMDGFGRFDFQLQGKGWARTDELSFKVSGVSLGNFDPLFFAAHVASFEWRNIGDERHSLCSGKDCLTSAYFTSSMSTTPVPIPAAVWLFGSGLIGLVAVARRKA
ncbi:VPLPA-CTERM sorting domain-containing protein [Sulfuricaulis sp.]|jgi:hypothetical protein|uniref:VPLPA-CTERM sorting domain-containing protein n=1 Tax=Sulfuricaulis sp. TaxID=2003553 RepID=UPI0035593A9A